MHPENDPTVSKQRKGDARTGNDQASSGDRDPTRVLLGVHLISAITAGLLIPVLPLYVLSKGFSFAQLGTVFTFIAVTTIGIQLVAGRHANLLARPIILSCLLLMPAFTFPLYLRADSLLDLVVVSMVGAAGGAVAGPALQVLIASVATRQQLAFLYSKFGLVKSFSYAAGVVLGGLLLAIGYEAVFYLASALSVAAFALTIVLLTRNKKSPSRSRPVTSALSPAHALLVDLQSCRSDLSKAHRGLQPLRPVPRVSRTNIRLASIHAFLFTFTLSIYPVYFPMYLLSFGLPIYWIGVVVAASWVTFGLAQPVGARYADRTGRHRELIVVSLLCASALNLFMATMSLLWVVLAWVLLGIADGVGRPVTQAWLVSGVPVSDRGMAFGWTMAAGTLARVVAPLGFALIIISGGIQTALMWVVCILGLSIFPIVYFKELSQTSAATAAPRSEASA